MLKSDVNNSNKISYQPSKQNTECECSASPSKESISKIRPDSTKLKLTQDESSEVKLNSSKMNEQTLPPLQGNKITVAMQDSDIYVPISNKNRIFKDYIRREQLNHYNSSSPDKYHSKRNASFMQIENSKYQSEYSNNLSILPNSLNFSQNAANFENLNISTKVLIEEKRK